MRTTPLAAAPQDATTFLKRSVNKPPRGLDAAMKKILLAPKTKVRPPKGMNTLGI